MNKLTTMTFRNHTFGISIPTPNDCRVLEQQMKHAIAANDSEARTLVFMSILRLCLKKVTTPDGPYLLSFEKIGSKKLLTPKCTQELLHLDQYSLLELCDAIIEIITEVYGKKTAH